VVAASSSTSLLMRTTSALSCQMSRSLLRARKVDSRRSISLWMFSPGMNAPVLEWVRVPFSFWMPPSWR
jgi:hypothetical protein